MENKNKNKLEEMVSLQGKLNDETNGLGWELGVNKYGKDIDWLTCMFMESAESLDSSPWKHWKAIDGKIDLENIKIETVDKWHFLMSHILQFTQVKNATNIIYIQESFKEYLSMSSIKDLSETTIDVKEKTKDFKKAILNLNISIFKLVELEMIMEEAYLEKNKGSLEDFSRVNFFLMPEYFAVLCELINKFFELAMISELSYDELYKLYIGKNCLNKFRQDNGYKEGTYVKIWYEGKEDNVIMQSILKDNKDISFEGLYEKLKESYAIVIYGI
jgi:dimeric dUTPase (all-alpha-NTP-PPase superfamily)